MYHNYSTGTDGRVSTAMIDEAIAADLIASQSFKLASHSGQEANGPLEILAGDHDAVIDGDADACAARAPWPIILCFFHEPGGNFTTDTLRTNYRAAFRYIVNRYRNRGVTNVCWTQIQEAPYDFRPTPAFPSPPGGGRNVDWRKFHPDWKGTTTNTVADWYTGADQVCDIF